MITSVEDSNHNHKSPCILEKVYISALLQYDVFCSPDHFWLAFDLWSSLYIFSRETGRGQPVCTGSKVGTKAHSS